MTMKRELNKRNGARNVINRNLTGQRAFSLIGALCRLLAFAVLSIASTSSAWAVCNPRIGVILTPASQAYSSTRTQTITITGTIAKELTGCANVGTMTGNVNLIMGSLVAGASFNSANGAYSGQLTTPRGFTLGTKTLQVQFRSTNNKINHGSRIVSYQVVRAPQTISGLPTDAITFAPGKSIPLNINSSSGLPVAVTATPPNVCSINAGNLIVNGAGSCSISAFQDGGANYLPVTRTGSVLILGASQTIFFTRPADRIFTAGETITLSARASSGLPVTFSTPSYSTRVCTVRGNILTIKTTGFCYVTASQAGNSSYNSVQSIAGFRIVTADQTITFTNPGPQSFPLERPLH